MVQDNAARREAGISLWRNGANRRVPVSWSYMPTTRVAPAVFACGLCFAAAAHGVADNGAPSISSDSLVNAATGQMGFAPYSICSLYGTDFILSGDVADTGGAAQFRLFWRASRFSSASLPRGLFYVSPNQINLLIPNSLLPATYSLRVVHNGVPSPSLPFVIQEVAPEISSLRRLDSPRRHTPMGRRLRRLLPRRPAKWWSSLVQGSDARRRMKSIALSRRRPQPLFTFLILRCCSMAWRSIHRSSQYAERCTFQREAVSRLTSSCRVICRSTTNPPKVQVSEGGLLSPGGLSLNTTPVGTANLARPQGRNDWIKDFANDRQQRPKGKIYPPASWEMVSSLARGMGGLGSRRGHGTSPPLIA